MHLKITIYIFTALIGGSLYASSQNKDVLIGSPNSIVDIGSIDSLSNFQRVCKGIVLNKTHILTAGHCLAFLEINRRAYNKESFVLYMEELYHIESLYISKFFRTRIDKTHDDLGILKLKKI